MAGTFLIAGVVLTGLILYGLVWVLLWALRSPGEVSRRRRREWRATDIAGSRPGVSEMALPSDWTKASAYVEAPEYLDRRNPYA